MRIVLIGLSGVGKSHWSTLLSAELGFEHICCDDLIEEKLTAQLSQYGSGIGAVAQWMGQPYDPQFKECEAEYLKYEQEVLSELFAVDPFSENAILDTTGSVIYLSEKCISLLPSFGMIVYLVATQDQLDEMFLQYWREPKPVVWGESFSQDGFDTHEEALRGCYPRLLDYRLNRYAELAQVTISYDQLRQPGFGVQEFLSLVQSPD